MDILALWSDQILYLQRPSRCAVTDLDLTAWFLAYGADPNASSIMEETPLSTAVRDAPFLVIQMLFAHSGNVNQGHLLHSAVWRKLDDRKTVMEFLIRKGAPVNAVMYEDRPELYLIRKPFGLGTPLHTAAATGHELATVHGSISRTHAETWP